MFVCKFYSPCVYPFHVQEIEECSKHRFYSAAAFSSDTVGIRGLHLLMHLVIKWLVNAITYFFVFWFPDTFLSQWTTFTILCTTSIHFLLAITAFYNLFKGYNGFIPPLTFIPVFLLVVNKSFPFRFGGVYLKVQAWFNGFFSYLIYIAPKIQSKNKNK